MIPINRTRNTKKTLTNFGGLSRSNLMARIKSKGNISTELMMMKALRGAEIKGWRRHLQISGRPDFSWPSQRVALFVDGCFWHGCPRCYKIPKNNVRYWADKMAKNKRRDNRINSYLRRSGWTVLRIWECRIKEKNTMVRIMRALHINGD